EAAEPQRDAATGIAGQAHRAGDIDAAVAATPAKALHHESRRVVAGGRNRDRRVTGRTYRRLHIAGRATAAAEATDTQRGTAAAARGRGNRTADIDATIAATATNGLRH